MEKTLLLWCTTRVQSYHDVCAVQWMMCTMRQKVEPVCRRGRHLCRSAHVAIENTIRSAENLIFHRAGSALPEDLVEVSIKKFACAESERKNDFTGDVHFKWTRRKG